MGLIPTVLIIVGSFISKSEKIFIYGTQIIGFGSLGLAALLSGVMSDNIYRRTAVENQKERFQRMNTSTSIILFGSSSVIFLIIYYVFIN